MSTIPTIRVRAVEGRHSPLHNADGSVREGRYAGRGPGPSFDALPDGEEVPDTAEHRKAVAQGDLELVQIVQHVEPMAHESTADTEATTRRGKVVR